MTFQQLSAFYSIVVKEISFLLAENEIEAAIETSNLFADPKMIDELTPCDCLCNIFHHEVAPDLIDQLIAELDCKE